MKRSFQTPFRRTAIAGVVGMAFWMNAAWAVTPFVVKDIKVQGLQKVDAGTVFATLPVKVGEQYDDDKGAAAIRALYGLGLFNDVRIDTQGDNLVVVVQERPTIDQVDITGAHQFEKKQILSGLGNTGISSGRPYDKSLEDAAVQELKRQYQAKGYYDTDIVVTTTPVGRNRVNVNYTISEGVPARIRSIHIVGNHAFGESTLLGQMSQDTGGWMSWYTKSNRYTDTKLNADLDALRQYYLNRGYMEFQVNSSQAALSADKKGIDITVNVTEGPRYVVSGVSLSGNYLEKEDEFKSLVKIKPGAPYKQSDVDDTVKAMTEHFGTYGYAFAKITPQPVISRDKQEVALVLASNPDQRAYVRRINISGNTKTRDEVIRREFRQYESSWYNADKLRLSKERIDRLGYFTDVAIDTQPVPGTPDQADLNVAVKERPTGSIQLGAGYSTSDKVSVTFGISQENIFGSGQSLSLDVNTSKYNRTLSISSTDPYFTNDGVSRTFNLTYSRTTPYSSQGSNVFDYYLQRISGSVNFGIPVTENDTIYVGGGLEHYKIDQKSLALPAEYQDFIDSNKGKSSAYGVPLTIGWSKDKRDSALAPTSGTYQRLWGAISPAGDLRYALATYNFQYFYPLSKQYTFAFNTDLGYGKGIGGKAFPVFKNFYEGGLGSVRGFEQSAIGPYATASDGTTYAVGGNRKFNVNLELVTPFPGAGNDKTLRLFGFLDAGNVYSEVAQFNTDPNVKKVRVSAGIGIRWISPMGPLSIAFGRPLKKYSGDKTQPVQFQIGTSF